MNKLIFNQIFNHHFLRGNHIMILKEKKYSLICKLDKDGNKIWNKKFYHSMYIVEGINNDDPLAKSLTH